MTNYIINSWRNLKPLKIVYLSVLDRKRHVVISKALLFFLKVIGNTLCEIPLLVFDLVKNWSSFSVAWKFFLSSICDIFLHDLLSLAMLGITLWFECAEAI